MSTLTLNITASEPRLDTGCWLDITRWELPPLYDISLNPLDTLVTNNNDLSLSISHYLFKVSSYENLLASCGRSQIFTERTSSRIKYLYLKPSQNRACTTNAHGFLYISFSYIINHTHFYNVHINFRFYYLFLYLLIVIFVTVSFLLTSSI